MSLKYLIEAGGVWGLCAWKTSFISCVEELSEGTGNPLRG